MDPTNFLCKPARTITGVNIGFTVVELVVVLTIAGIVALVAIPRFMGPSGFQSRGFYDQAKAMVRIAQKVAIAERANATLPKTLIFVVVSATDIQVCRAAGCGAGTQVLNPATGAPLAATVPSGVTLSPVGNFTFNGMGQPSVGTTITLTSTIADDPARQIVVEAETGYVHP